MSEDKNRHLKRANLIAETYAKRPSRLLRRVGLDGAALRLSRSLRDRELRAAKADADD